MKRFTLWMVAAAVLVPASASAQVENLSWAERLGVALLSKELGLNADTVLGTRSEIGRSVFEIAPLFAIGQHTNRDHVDIWKLRASGLGWGQIAQRLNMHPGTFNKLRKKGHFDNNLFWPNVLERRFDMTDAQIRTLRKQGFKWDDMAAISHLSYRSGSTPSQVAARFKTDRDWDKVRANLKVKDDFKKGSWKVSTTKGKSNGNANKIKTSTSGKGNTKVKSGGGSGKAKIDTKSGGKQKSGKGKSGGSGKGKGGG